MRLVRYRAPYFYGLAPAHERGQQQGNKHCEVQVSKFFHSESGFCVCRRNCAVFFSDKRCPPTRHMTEKYQWENSLWAIGGRTNLLEHFLYRYCIKGVVCLAACRITLFAKKRREAKTSAPLLAGQPNSASTHGYSHRQNKHSAAPRTATDVTTNAANAQQYLID